MKILRITLAQINTVVGDIDGNATKIINCIKKARSLDADIVVFPELCLCGYPAEDLLLKEHFIRKIKQQLKRIKIVTDDILTIVGLPLHSKGKLFNTALFLHQKKILGFYSKLHLPNYGVFDEMRYFTAGDSISVLKLKQGLSIGVNICEDIWQEDGPAKYQSCPGRAKIIINISSSPYHALKIKLRETLLSKRAKENSAYLFYCNLVGGQDELVFDGASMIFDPRGRLISRAKQFREDLLTVDIDYSSLISRSAREVNRKSKVRLKYIRVGLKLKDKSSTLSPRIEKRLKPLSEIYEALVLGLKDYVVKNGFNKVLLGISGGVDSSLVATIAVDALGKRQVLALSMPSVYTSQETKQDAKRLSSNLGISLTTISIDGIYKKYLEVLRGPFKKRRRDVTEENIQARIRGNILMALSNKFRLLVVTTGNKSELSVGYCTLYGDTAGGFALLKDVPKTLVYKLVEFRNAKEKRELIPLSILKRPPTAELKKKQTDQDVLPPYASLDTIMDAYVRKDQAIEEIVKRGFSQRLVRRVIKMIDKNEYKRRQYAVGIKITPKAFGRDRRMPITNRFIE